MAGALDADSWLARAAWQPVIFATRLKRAALLALEPTWPRQPLHVHVLRNQPFEFVASVLDSFAAYAGRDLRVTLGGYDDSLSDLDVGEPDVVLVWLDYDRYEEDPNDIARWLTGRMVALRALTSSPVLVHDQAPPDTRAAELNQALRRSLADIPGIHVVDQAAIAVNLGNRYLDERAASISGFAVGDAGCLETARALGLRWLPAASGAGIRAVVVDLDGTLYDGVLAEDGIANVRVAAGHQALAHRLLELRDHGIFLGLLSQNDPDDVQDLFASREDLPIRPDHFSVVSASWDPKSERLGALIDQLRIAPESVLFLDDNPGELAAVANRVPGVHCVWADPDDPDATARLLHWYPGLEKLEATEADARRVTDLAAADRRHREREEAADAAVYLRSLEIEVTLSADPTEHLSRLQELSAKTNQFNTTLRRLSAGELARRTKDPGSRVISAALRDRLSDSGIVASLVCHREPERIVVDELAMSCRALGRGVETALVLTALRRVVGELGSRTVIFPFTIGPRNQPARQWLAEVTGGNTAEGAEVRLEWSEADVHARLADVPVTLRWADAR